MRLSTWGRRAEGRGGGPLPGVRSTRSRPYPIRAGCQLNRPRRGGSSRKNRTPPALGVSGVSRVPPPRCRSDAWPTCVLALLIGEREWGPLVAGLVYAVLLSSCSVSLLVIPISRSRVLPDRRRPLWVPLIYSATLAATVFFGLAIASHEFAGPLGGRKDSPGFGITAWAIFGGTPVVWVAWLIIFNDPREG